MPLDVFNIVELRSQRIIDINDDDLPIGFLLVKKSHDPEDLDLLNLAAACDELTDLANIERIIIAFCLCLWVDDVRIFPSLEWSSVDFNV